MLDWNCPGEGGERFAVFGKTKAFSQRNPGRLSEAMCRDSCLGQRPALSESVPTGLFKNLPQFIWRQAEQCLVTPSWLFPSRHFRGAALKQGDEFGERGRELIGQGNLPNRRRAGRSGRIQLPKNVQNYFLIQGVFRVPVRVPI